MNKEELIEIYKHTKELCSGFAAPLSEKKTLKECHISSFEKKAGVIIVEPLDTVSALAKYVNDGKTAVLNMANAKNKGGGVEKGSMAQEECLFRCSNLFQIPDEFYPITIDELIYTHQATFVKCANYGTIWPMEADVITIAAPNLNINHNGNEQPEYTNESYYIKVMSNKIDAMLSIASTNECKNIILGAWGCGAFKNDPVKVSELFKNALEEKRYMFDKVIFAVINDRNSVGNNYQIFYDAFL